MPLRLVQHLVARGLLTDEQGQGVLQAVSKPGTAVDTVLLERGLVPELELLESLGACSGLRPVNLADFEPNPQVGAWVPVHIAERWCVTPLSIDGPVLHVASGYPVARRELEEMGVLIGRPLELWVSTELRVRDWISNVYGTPLPPHLWRLLAQLDPPRAALYPPPPSEPGLPDVAPAIEAPPASPRAPEGTHDTPHEELEVDVDLELEGSPTPTLVPEVTSAANNASRAQTTQPAEAQPPGPQASPAPAAQEPAAATPAPIARRRVRAAPWLPPSLQAAIERGEDISERLADAPLAAQLGWAVAPRRPRGLEAQAAAQRAASSHAEPTGPVQEDEDGLDEPVLIPEPEEIEPSETATSEAAAPGAIQEEASAPRAPHDVHVSSPSRDASPLQSTPEATPAPPPGTSPSHDSAIPTPVVVEEMPLEVPNWTLTQARAALTESSKDRDKLLDTVLRYANRTFGFAAVFAVRRGEAAGWRARGGALDAPDFSQVRIPLDAPGLFRTVSVTRGSYVGAMPADPITRDYLASFGRAPPRAVFAFPVEVRSRLVAIVYGDNGAKPISQRRVSDFLLFCQGLPGAFQQLLLQRRRESHDTLPPEPALPGATPPPVLSPVPEAGAQSSHAPGSPGDASSAGSDDPGARPAPVGWESFAHGDQSPTGRAASLPPILPAREYAPSDFGPLLKRLTGPDPAARLRAVAELARTPDASAKALARAFPGPSAWSRMPVVELPEAEELGPIPGALARLGRAGAGALAGLLDRDDAEIRYLALLTAGSLPYPVLVDGILRGLFDLEPDISSAARAAAAALKHVPRLEMSLPALRRELVSRDPLRRSLVARALGALHDRAAIDGLINLTGSDDAMCAQAAADALREITRLNFGLRQPDWTRWWAENRTRRRAEWLVNALRHPDLDQRTAAFEELSHALSDSLGYAPDAAAAEREAGAKRWEAALHHPIRGRRLAAL